MSNPTAAARRLLAGPRSYRDGTHSEQADVQTVAEAVLSVHDDTPIDEAWLRSVGFKEYRSAPGMPIDMLEISNGCTQLSMGYRDQWLVNGVELDEAAWPTTRGALRLLAMALGVTIRENHDG